MASQLTAGKAFRIVLVMGWSDFLLKYRGSLLGYFWSLAVPVTKFLVIYYVFRSFFAQGIPQYPYYLFLGLIIWEHFAMTTSACIGMLFDKMAIIQRIVFPRLLLILIVGWEHLIIFFTYFLIFFLAIEVRNVGFPPSAVYLPIIFLQMTLFALGVGMLLSAFSLKFRDISHLWFVTLQILFWLTPIMYNYRADEPLSVAIRGVPTELRDFSLGTLFDLFVRFQPLSIIIHDARRVALYGDLPTFVHAIGVTAMSALIFAAGAFVFHRRSKYFIQEY